MYLSGFTQSLKDRTRRMMEEQTRTSPIQSNYSDLRTRVNRISESIERMSFENTDSEMPVEPFDKVFKHVSAQFRGITNLSERALWGIVSIPLNQDAECSVYPHGSGPSEEGLDAIVEQSVVSGSSENLWSISVKSHEDGIFHRIASIRTRALSTVIGRFDIAMTKDIVDAVKNRVYMERLSAIGEYMTSGWKEKYGDINNIVETNARSGGSAIGSSANGLFVNQDGKLVLDIHNKSRENVEIAVLTWSMSDGKIHRVDEAFLSENSEFKNVSLKKGRVLPIEIGLDNIDESSADDTLYGMVIVSEKKGVDRHFVKYLMEALKDGNTDIMDEINPEKQWGCINFSIKRNGPEESRSSRLLNLDLD